MCAPARWNDKMAMIKKVGVIGSGQMGSGIAHVAALAGFDVVLNDISADRLKSGMATINGNPSVPARTGVNALALIGELRGETVNADLHLRVLLLRVRHSLLGLTSLVRFQ